MMEPSMAPPMAVKKVHLRAPPMGSYLVYPTVSYWELMTAHLKGLHSVYLRDFY